MPCASVDQGSTRLKKDMAAHESPSQGAHFRKRRAALVLLGLFALAVCVILLGGYWFLQDARKRILHDLERDMGVQAGSEVALVTVWTGSLLDQVRNFAGQDMLRLFAEEVTASGIPADTLLRMARGEDTEAASGTPNEVASRVSVMSRQLSAFAQKNGLLAGSLVTTDFQVYLSSEDVPQLGEEQRVFLAQALQSGEPVFLPVRRWKGELAMEMAFPVFAPLYVDASGKKTASFLLVTCSIQQLAKAITRHATAGNFGSAIVQHFGDRLQRIDPEHPDGVVDQPQWRMENGSMPLRLRPDTALQNGEVLYILAQPVPNLPWLVEQATRADFVEESYAGIRTNVVWVCFLLTVLAGLLLTFLWWWLVGRNERAMTAQLRQLYLVVSQQKQIMDGVNSALSAGIVLNDLDGVICYANQSFARMAGKSGEELPGLPHTALAHDLARSLATHTVEIHKTGMPASFTEPLLVGGEARVYHVSCTPFGGDDGRLAGIVSVYSDMTDQARAQQKAQKMVGQTVRAFVRSIEAVDAYLQGQSAFTAQLAVLLSSRLGRDDAETLSTLGIAANLSHLGMVRLPRELITKSGALTREERAQMQRHVEYARDVLEDIDFGLPVLEAIVQSCERLDGSGYPAGLAGDAICPNARVLAVANTFCALVRPRSYRGAHSAEEALRILEQTPPRYDAHVVSALRALLDTEEGQAFLLQLGAHRPQTENRE